MGLRSTDDNKIIKVYLEMSDSFLRRFKGNDLLPDDLKKTLIEHKEIIETFPTHFLFFFKSNEESPWIFLNTPTKDESHLNIISTSLNRSNYDVYMIYGNKHIHVKQETIPNEKTS